jgi:hypothetical protein
MKRPEDHKGKVANLLDHYEIDMRRVLVKTGAMMIWLFGAPGLYAEQWGTEGIILYIASVNFFRWVFTEISTLIGASHAIGVSFYRWSPIAIIAAGVLIFIAPNSEISLLLIPILIAIYVSAYYPFYYEVYSLRRIEADGFQRTEVLGSLCSAALCGLVTWGLDSIAAPLILGSAIVAITFFMEVGVSNKELHEGLSKLREKAVGRDRRMIAKGHLIIICMGGITFTSLSDFRIHEYTGAEVAVDAIIDLSLAMVIAEVLCWCITTWIPFDDSRIRWFGCTMTVFGFVMMFFDQYGYFIIGYIAVTAISRAINRAQDYKHGRNALKGVGRRPALRELTRYRTMALLTPLLLFPSAIPLVGCFFAVVLVMIPFDYEMDMG